jgi:hypothetical protein
MGPTSHCGACRFVDTERSETLVPRSLSLDQARNIARDAYIYGFPPVGSYRIQYSYFMDHGNPEFKAACNTIFNNARVNTPDVVDDGVAAQSSSDH